jgi:DNA-binding transcriptional ArsR family regulator
LTSARARRAPSGEPLANWEAVARGHVHPLRLKIIERASQGRWFSPSDLARELGEPLGNVSYHVKALLRQGLLVLAGTETRRGAIEHYYRASESLRAG